MYIRELGRKHRQSQLGAREGQDSSAWGDTTGGFWKGQMDKAKGSNSSRGIKAKEKRIG